MQWPPGIRASRPRSLVRQRRLSFVPVVHLTAHAEYGLLHPGFELMLALVPYAAQIELFRATFIGQKAIHDALPVPESDHLVGRVRGRTPRHVTQDSSKFLV